ncbi:MAG: ABC transporter ATP-binding protein [Treponema sp.]|jgi:sulfonate transport system ATP-binding protein|nr:ABC transporter ATP-binding protein [Treponema sp.]
METASDDKREVLVDVVHLTKSFGDLLVLNDVSFRVRKGEFLCIVGPTGCGKTTFLNSLSTIFDITAGQININGEPVNLRKHNISYVLQEASTMPWLTVEENVRFGLNIKKVPGPEADKHVNDVLEMVRLEECRSYYPSQLSVSMLQRVVIARAFVTQPQLLLMDEPYGQLDLSLRYRLEDELLELWRRMGTTVIFITHNIEEACYLGERVLVLTNKPTTIKENIHVAIPHPRSISDPEFVKLRNHVTEQIKWW